MDYVFIFVYHSGCSYILFTLYSMIHLGKNLNLINVFSLFIDYFVTYRKSKLAYNFVNEFATRLHFVEVIRNQRIHR